MDLMPEQIWASSSSSLPPAKIASIRHGEFHALFEFRRRAETAATRLWSDWQSAIEKYVP